MPTGPNGQKRPADVIGAAIKVARIATGEESDDTKLISSAAAMMGQRGGKARAASMSAERRAEIARAAAATRWSKSGSKAK